MSVSTRRAATLLPGVWAPGADGMGRIMVPATPPGQTRAEEDEIPIASYEEETANEGKNGGSQEATLHASQVS